LSLGGSAPEFLRLVHGEYPDFSQNARSAVRFLRE
jgi:hypothetical protein